MGTDGPENDDDYPPAACAHARNCGGCGSRIMDLEGQVLSMTRYLSAVADLMEGHGHITASVRSMANMYGRTARSIEQQRLAVLSADLAADPDLDEQGG